MEELFMPAYDSKKNKIKVASLISLANYKL